MSINTHTASGSPILNAMQHLCAQLVPVVHYCASNVDGATSDTANVIAERKPMGFFKRLGQSIERREMERQEAYLAESSDIYDLEHRMKQLEHMRSYNANQWGSNSQYY